MIGNRIDDDVAEMVFGWNHSHSSKLALVLTSFPFSKRTQL
jgi:hypothetical protein